MFNLISSEAEQAMSSQPTGTGTDTNLGKPEGNQQSEFNMLKPELKPQGQPAQAEPATVDNPTSQKSSDVVDNSDFIKKFKEENPNFKDKSVAEIFESFKNANGKINEQSLKIKELEKQLSESKKSETGEPETQKQKDLKANIAERKQKRDDLIAELKKGLSVYTDEDYAEKFVKAFDALTNNEQLIDNSEVSELKKTVAELQKKNAEREKIELQKQEFETKQKLVYDSSNSVISELKESNLFSQDEIAEAISMMKTDYAKETYMPLIEIALQSKDPAKVKATYKNIFENAIYMIRGKAMPELMKQNKKDIAKSIAAGQATININSQNNTGAKSAKFLKNY